MTSTPETAARSVQRGRLSRVGEQLAVPVAIVVAIIIGAFLSDRFLTLGNLLNVLTSMSIVGIVSVGMAVVLISGGLADLSVPATVAAGAIVTLAAQPVLGAGSIVLAVIVGLLIGTINGLLVGYAKANPIIATLGVSTACLGFVQAFLGGSIVYGHDKALVDFVNSRPLGIPLILIVFVVVAVLGHMQLTRTVWGRQIFAVGGNYAAAEASTVRVRRLKASAFMLTAGLASMSGAYIGLSLNVAQPLIGTGYEFDAITAVVVGGISLLGGAGSISRALLGVLFVQLLTNILVLEGVPDQVQGIAKGTLIALAVGLDVWFRNRGGRR